MSQSRAARGDRVAAPLARAILAHARPAALCFRQRTIDDG